MAYLPASSFPTRTAPATPSRLRTFGATVLEYLHLFAAATRAARAVEARRHPNPADLKLLGITTKLPGRW